MSHFTSIRTQIKNLDALKKALADLGFKQIEIHNTARNLYGYRGDARSQTAEVIVRRQFIGAASNDIGFKQQADGTYEAVISEYDRKRYSQQWLNHLMQRYGYHTLMSSVSEQGLTIEEQETLEDGTIRVVVGKWSG